MKRRQNEQDRLQSQIATYQSKIDAAPLREAQLVELTRNYEVSKQHYQTLLDGTFNIGMAADLEQKQATERFTVLDFAQTPQKPIQPKRKQLIPLGALVALGLSIFGVIVKDTQNPAVKSEMELKSLLPAGVRVWGFIPRIEVAVDTRRARRSAIYASIACILLGAAVFVVILANRPL